MRTWMGGLLICMTWSCGGQTSDPGVNMWLHIENAQRRFGSMPTGMPSGPRVVSAQGTRRAITPGLIDENFQALLDLNAQAAAIGIPGDRGYWITTAQPPLVEVPGSLSVSLVLSFAPTLVAGPFQVRVQAVNAAAQFGLPSFVDYIAGLSATAALDTSTAPLTISLAWDTESDLDIHVLDPTGVEIYWGKTSSYVIPGPGGLDNPSALAEAGNLDFDSNAQCVIDGRRLETITYPQRTPSGHYIVRVDTFSLCATPSAHWTVEARSQGQVFARTQGISLPTDTRAPHEQGAGLLVLEFEKP